SSRKLVACCRMRDLIRSRQWQRSEEHTSELQSRPHLVCRLLLEKKKKEDNHQTSAAAVEQLEDSDAQPPPPVAALHLVRWAGPGPSRLCVGSVCFFFFFNDTATTEIYPLSLHDALPIYALAHRRTQPRGCRRHGRGSGSGTGDRR